MKHRLNEYRQAYQTSREILGGLNKVKAAPHRKSAAFSRMNKTRNLLLKEVQRVSSILWPITGRPYMGRWIVVNKLNGGTVLRSSMVQCLEFCTESRYGHHYRIDKG